MKFQEFNCWGCWLLTEAKAYHHRVDSLTAFVALFTIVVSHFLEGARWLDPVGGLVISGMIVQAGWSNTKSALFELADVGMDEEAREGAESAIKNVLESGKAEVRGVQGIKSGQNLMFEVEVGVPVNWSVKQANELETEIREAVSKKVKGTKRVNVRFVTLDGAQGRDAFADQFTSKESQALDEPMDDEHHHHDHDHDHDHHHGDGHQHSTRAQQANGATTHKRK